MTRSIIFTATILLTSAYASPVLSTRGGALTCKSNMDCNPLRESSSNVMDAHCDGLTANDSGETTTVGTCRVTSCMSQDNAPNPQDGFQSCVSKTKSCCGESCYSCTDPMDGGKTVGTADCKVNTAAVQCDITSCIDGYGLASGKGCVKN